MMKIALLFGMLLSMLWSLAEARIPGIQANELLLRDQARACYFSLVKLYDAQYFRSDDGRNRCIKLDYLREFSQEDLAEATQKVFAKLHGEEAVVEFAQQLARVNNAYQPVSLGNSYQYCVSRETGGEMIRDGRVVVSLNDIEFSERFMNIWVIGEENDGKPRWNFSRCPTLVF